MLGKTFKYKLSIKIPENASRQHQHNRPFTTKPFTGLLCRWRSYRMSLPRSVTSLSQPSRTICQSHIGDFSCPAQHVVFSLKIIIKHGLLGKRGDMRVLGLLQFVAYTPNKESWKPVRDQSYSPKGLTARCPHNTFKASNSPPDQMQPGSCEKHWATHNRTGLCSQPQPACRCRDVSDDK